MAAGLLDPSDREEGARTRSPALAVSRSIVVCRVWARVHQVLCYGIK